jgi:chaperonin GroEL
VGYDARGERYCDLVESGIIDPAKVVKSAVRHSASAACNLLSIGAAVTFDLAPEGLSDEQSALLF